MYHESCLILQLLLGKRRSILFYFLLSIRICPAYSVNQDKIRLQCCITIRIVESLIQLFCVLLHILQHDHIRNLEKGVTMWVNRTLDADTVILYITIKLLRNKSLWVILEDFTTNPIISFSYGNSFQRKIWVWCGKRQMLLVFV